MTGSTTRVSFMAALHCAPMYVCVCVCKEHQESINCHSSSRGEVIVGRYLTGVTKHAATICFVRDT